MLLFNNSHLMLLMSFGVYTGQVSPQRLGNVNIHKTHHGVMGPGSHPKRGCGMWLYPNVLLPVVH